MYNVATGEAFNFTDLRRGYTVPAGMYELRASGLRAPGGTYWQYAAETHATPPIPEPTTFALALAGLALMGGVCWRRRRSEMEASR
jgi:hypothetical protein